MDCDIKNILVSNIDIISSVFKRNKKEVIKVLDNLSGSKDEILYQLFSGLNLPLNNESLLIINSIIKEGYTKNNSLLYRIKRLFRFK
jgi:hypothetical protein